jgi:hypothetical protein
MAMLSVINVDLADVFAQPNRQGFPYTLAWGDAVEVLETTSTNLCISTVKYEERDDGSILPDQRHLPPVTILKSRQRTQTP